MAVAKQYLDEKESHGNGNLHLAALSNKPDELERLLSLGAEINAVNSNKETALMIAVRKQFLNCVRVLMNHAANLDVNSQDRWGYTALHEAVEKNSLDIVNLLLNFPSADVAVVNKKGFNVLHSAAFCGNNFAIEKILLRWLDVVDEKDAGGDAPLHLAVVSGHYRVVETLLIQGLCDIDIQNEQRHTALLLAALGGRCDLVELLVREGGNVNMSDQHGHRPIHAALKARLTLHPSSVGACCAPAITAIAERILNCSEPGVDSSLAVACYLTSKGGDLHRAISNGVTPLDMAGNGAVLTLLVFWKDPDRAAAALSSSRGCELACGTTGWGAGLVGGSSNSSANGVTSCRKRDWLEPALQCDICMERVRNVAFLCGHWGCHACAEPLDVCHLCRAATVQKIQLF